MCYFVLSNACVCQLLELFLGLESTVTVLRDVLYMNKLIRINAFYDGWCIEDGRCGWEGALPVEPSEPTSPALGCNHL